MRRVTGIGGIFFKAKDPDTLREWYRVHLGLDVQAWGGAALSWREGAAGDGDAATIWSVFPASSDYYPAKGYILGLGCALPINTPPENVHALMAAARDYGRWPLEPARFAAAG